MSDEREAFIREIATHPDEDAPRLIYADWLEERGDPQGQFIRVQCELAAGVDDRPRAAFLRERESLLLQEHGTSWIESLGVRILWYRWSRGLIEEIVVDAASLAEGGRLLSLTPISSLGTRLRTVEEVQRLGEICSLDQLRKLRLGHSDFKEQRLALFLRPARLTNLRELWLSNCGLQDRDAEALALKPLGNLQKLVLIGNALSEQTARKLRESLNLKRLENLAVDRPIMVGDSPHVEGSPTGARGMTMAEVLARSREQSPDPTLRPRMSVEEILRRARQPPNSA